MLSRHVIIMRTKCKVAGKFDKSRLRTEIVAEIADSLRMTSSAIRTAAAQGRLGNEPLGVPAPQQMQTHTGATDEPNVNEK